MKLIRPVCYDDQVSKLGLDSTDLQTGLRELDAAWENYGKSIRKSVTLTQAVNRAFREQPAAVQGADDALKQATSSYNKLVVAQGKAIAQNNAMAQSQRELNLELQKGATSFGKGGLIKSPVSGSSPLGAKVAALKEEAAQVKANQQAQLDAETKKNLKAQVASNKSAATTIANQKRLKEETDKEVASFLDGIKKKEEAVKGLQISLGSIAKIAITQAALSGFFKLFGAFVEGAEAAKKFELQLAAVETLDRQFASRGLQGTADTVTEISRQFGLPLEEVATGLYDTLSNQIGNAAESTTFLKDAATFAQASVSSLADSANLLAAVLNAYGLSAANADTISGKLFRTIDLGRVTAQELANSIGRVLPLANELSVSLDEVFASVATMTIQGVQANEAYTLLSNVMLKLLKPTKSLKDEFERLGISSVGLAIRGQGLQGFLQDITARSGTAASEIGGLFNQIRGTRGVLILVGKSAEQYAENLRKIKDAGAEAAEGAAALVTATPAFQLQKEFADLRAFLVNDFGRTFNEVFLKVIQLIGGARKAFETLAAAIAGATIAATLFGIVKAFNAIGTAFKALSGISSLPALFALIAANPFVAIGAAAVAAAAAFLIFGNNAQTAAEKLKALNDEEDRNAKAAKSVLGQRVKDQTKQLGELAAEYDAYLRAVTRQHNQEKAEATEAFGINTKILENQLNKRVQSLNSYVTNLENTRERAQKAIRDIAKANAELKNNASNGAFERSIKNAPPQQEAAARSARALQLIQAAKRAQAKGNDEIAQQLATEAAAQADQVADLTGNESLVNRILNERIELNKTIVSQRQAEANAADAVAQQAQRTAIVVAAKAAEVEKLNKEAQSGKLNEKEFNVNRNQVKALTTDIEKEIANVPAPQIPILLDSISLQKQVNDLKQGFVNPSTGVASGLSQAFDDQFGQLANKLQHSLDNVPLIVKVKLEFAAGGQKIDLFGGPESLAAAIDKNFSEAGRQIQNQVEVPGAIAERNKANNNLKGDFDAARAALTGNVSFFGGIARQFTDLFTIPLGKESITSEVQRATAADKAKLDAIQKLAQTTIAGGGDIAPVLQQVLDLQKQAVASGDTKVAELLGKIRDGISDAAAAQAKAGQAIDTQGAIAPFLRGLTQGVAVDVNANTNPAQAALDSFLTVYQGKVVTINVVANKQGFAHGGVFGGDSVNASLTPGETVMDPIASQIFRPQLAMMSRMSRFAEGGSVTNTVGDVNIVMPKGQPIDGVAVAHRLKRELRKKSIRGF